MTCTTCPVCERPAVRVDAGAVRCPACGTVVARACCPTWVPRPHADYCLTLPRVQLLAAEGSARRTGLLRPIELLPLESERALLCLGHEVCSRALGLARLLRSGEERLREVSGAAWLGLWQILREEALVRAAELGAEQVALALREAA